MAFSAFSSFLPEEHYQCSICLEVFTRPVSLPCGHNFCMSCICRYWDDSGHCQCPLCKEGFEERPKLHVNTLIAEMAEQFKNISVGCSAGPGDVPCDICPRRKLRALKSCLVCLASYCEDHLEPHLRVATLKRHKLVEPVENIEDRMCVKHERFLELFCRSDQTCVCVLCTESDHKGHNTVPVEREWMEKKIQLNTISEEVQLMTQERLKKVDDIKLSVKLSKINTEQELEDSVQVFTDLICSIERSKAELIEEMEEKQRAAERRAEGLIKELEQEIGELQRRNTELEQLSDTEDHIYFLQSFPSMCDIPPTKDWSHAVVHTDLCVGTKWEAYCQLGETIGKTLDKQRLNELNRVRKYAVDVTLDPRTAHPSLVLSEDRKQVRDGDTALNVPDCPERFDSCLGVMGAEGLISGRHYWEVTVRGKTNWDLGVVRESICRKGELIAFPENGFWTVWLRNGTEYSANSSPPVSLSLSDKPQKVGVYLDYEDGQVSFYNVDAMSYICTFAGYKFSSKLYPYFSPCLNDGAGNANPLVISSISEMQSSLILPPKN